MSFGVKGGKCEGVRPPSVKPRCKTTHYLWPCAGRDTCVKSLIGLLNLASRNIMSYNVCVNEGVSDCVSERVGDWLD